MARIQLDKLEQNLMGAQLTPEQTEKVKAAVAASLPEKTYNMAVIFLGIATVALVLGSILLGGLGDVPEPLWGALGAGIGGLAGVFVGKSS